MQRLKRSLIVPMTICLFLCSSISPSDGTGKENSQPPSREPAAAATGEISDRKAGSGVDIEDFHALVIKTFSFSPHNLDKDKMDEKDIELNSFNNLVLSKGDIVLPKLREELKRGDNPSIFYWNGSLLLLSISNDVGDKQLAVSAIARCDLRDIDTFGFLAVVNRLAMEGIDTSMAAFRVLDYPDFKVFLPEHAIGVDMGFSLIFMLCPLPENLFIEKAIQRFEKEKNNEVKMALLGLLYFTVTPAGDEILDKTAKDEKESLGVRDAANKFIKFKSESTSMPDSNFDPKIIQNSIQELRNKRRDTLHEVSDEALEEFQKLSTLIRWKQAR
jgi:hypothetical protein